jgi:hypothetical protein
MDVHNYHAQTGEYLGTSIADESPLEPGVFLIPANATTVAPPPPQQGQARVFINGDWAFVPDHRGETWYAGHNLPVVIDTLGTPEGLTLQEPPAPAPPPRVIAGAYFRAALTNMGEIERVRAALTNPIDLELFNTASEFNIEAPDVNAVATALNIDLASVFDAAEAIRAARQPAA